MTNGPCESIVPHREDHQDYQLDYSKLHHYHTVVLVQKIRKEFRSSASRCTGTHIIEECMFKDFLSLFGFMTCVSNYKLDNRLKIQYCTVKLEIPQAWYFPLST